MQRSKKVLAVTASAVILAVPATTASAAPQEARQVNQGNLISALNNVAVQVDRVNALNDLTIADVRVVNVEDVLNNNRVLNNALNDNNVQILQDFLNGSLNNAEILNNLLQNANIAITDVVAVNVLSGGDVVVFTR